MWCVVPDGGQAAPLGHATGTGHILYGDRQRRGEERRAADPQPASKDPQRARVQIKRDKFRTDMAAFRWWPWRAPEPLVASPRGLLHLGALCGCREAP